MDLPKILYKFRTIDKYAEDILCNKRLFFPNWEELNDPHEVRICVKKPDEDMFFNMHPEQLKKWGVPVANHWWGANNSSPLRKCACGNPSHIIMENISACFDVCWSRNEMMHILKDMNL